MAYLILVVLETLFNLLIDNGANLRKIKRSKEKDGLLLGFFYPDCSVRDLSFVLVPDTIIMKKLTYISALIVLFAACKKENNAIEFQGNYTGTFKATYQNKTETSEAEINLNRPNFTMGKGIKLGSGTFVLEDKKTIIFADKNSWTTDFDFQIVLDGTYTFEALGDSLILTKRIYGPTDFINTYQYRLKRNN
jgi:hypothetical protein